MTGNERIECGIYYERKRGNEGIECGKNSIVWIISSMCVIVGDDEEVYLKSHRNMDRSLLAEITMVSSSISTSDVTF